MQCGVERQSVLRLSCCKLDRGVDRAALFHLDVLLQQLDDDDDDVLKVAAIGSSE